MKSIKITLVTLGLLVLSVAASYAQIKIGTNPTTINENSLLEVESDKKGILLPRLALQSAILANPLTQHVAGMIVYNTATAGTAPNTVVPGFYYNDGTKWLNLADLSVTTAKIDNLAVTNGKLAADAVTTDKILDGTILAADISTGAVTTTQILNGTIKNEDLNKTDIPLSGFAAATADVNLGSNKLTSVKDPTDAQDAATKKYVDDATTSIKTLESGKIYLGNASNVAEKVTMSGDVTIDNAGVTTIGASKVLTGMIANGTIIAEDIATGAVTTDKILDGTILAADIASGGNDKVLVTSSTGVVSWIDKTGFGALADQATIVGEGTTASKFSVKDGGISTDKLAESAVTSAKILNGTIIAEDIATSAVTTTQILDGTVATIDLADDAVTTSKIANGTIKNEDLNKTDIPLSGFAAASADVNLGSNKLTSVKDPTDAQDAATKKYVDDATTSIKTLESGKIYLGNASNVAEKVTMSGDVTIDNAGVTTIGASKVLTGMIADGTIITADLANDAVETAKIKDAAVTTAKILDANVTPAKIAPGTANQILVTTGTPAAVQWVSPTNTLTATNGQLVSTVNGLASTPAVNVLISADNGLTPTNGKVQLGGALTAATKITTDATKTLALEGLQAGANTDKMLVVDANGVIKTTSGRNLLEIVNKTANYTVVDTDHTILANLTGGAFTITLPAAAAENKGRVLLIRKTDETNNVLTFSESIKYSESTSFTTLNYLSTIRIQSDGTAWYKID